MYIDCWPSRCENSKDPHNSAPAIQNMTTDDSRVTGPLYNSSDSGEISQDSNSVLSALKDLLQQLIKILC